ncbi:hypothetical protein SLE2022_286530 [Rubroshorea leprosula]
MDATALKPSLLRNILLLRLLSFAVLILALRFTYLVAARGRSCVSGNDFCFSPVRRVSPLPLKKSQRVIDYYSTVFQDLILEGFLSPNSKSLCIGTLTGEEVYALKRIGVADSIGISDNASPPLILRGRPQHQPFDDNIFDFEYSNSLDQSGGPVEFVSEICRTLRPGGFVVVHTGAKDAYSLQSFLDLFNCCRLSRWREIEGSDPSSTGIREIVMKKEMEKRHPYSGGRKCYVPGLKWEIIQNAEPLIKKEPLKPWITLKRNMKNTRYLTSMVDIRFKQRYVYIDVGARNYGSSIGSWFKKQYPKQGKRFEIFAIEADKAFRGEYKMKKGVKLVPYAAWIRNETLFLEITRDPRGKEGKDRGRSRGRIHPVQTSTRYVGEAGKIEGFDFAEWLKMEVCDRDFVVMKMDVEGAEFHLIPRLMETGAICMVDEVFLKCHYNRWRRSPKYHKTYAQCLQLFASLRESGVLVHQWW